MADETGPAADGGWEHEVDEAERTFEALFVSRLSPRQRMLRAALAGGTLLLILALLLGGFPSIGAQLAAVVSRTAPAHTATPVANNGDAYYLDTNLPGMTATLDGKTIATNPLGTTQGQRMPHGRHQVTWQLAPFTAQSCVFSVPAKSSDTCQVASATRSGPTFAFRPDHFVLLHETLAMLPEERQHTLVAALEQSVSDLSTTVQPGELYYTRAQPNRTANQPLRASLRVLLSVQRSNRYGAIPACIFTRGASSTAPCIANFAVADCATLCILPFSNSASDFLALASATLQWDYTAADGHTVSLGQSNGDGDATTPHFVLFHVVWSAGSWQATLLAGPTLGQPILANNQQIATDPACIAAMDALYGESAGQFSDAVISFQSSGNPAEGCLSTLSTRDPQGTPLKFQFLSRFGILLPVDPAFQNLGPYVPRPSRAAKQVAHELAQYPAYIVDTLPLGVFPL